MMRRDEGEEADGYPSRFPGKITEDRSQKSEEPNRGQAGMAEVEEPHGPREGGQGDSDRERRKKGEMRYFSPQRPPLSVLHAGGKYLGVVANIITQADEAGFELFRTQRAGVILGPWCARQRAMRCQGRGGREGAGWG